MADREKVMQALKLCAAGCDDTGCIYDEETNGTDFRCVDYLTRDVLELLKEQEAKAGHWIDTTKVIGFPRVQCSVCGSGQGAIWMNYCPNCGAKMEGR